MTRIDPAYLTDLADDDYVIAMGDTEFHRVGDLRAAAAPRELRTNSSQETYPPPDDPYKRDAEALRAATETPLDRFERTYKADRLAALAAEHDRHTAAIRVTPTPRLSAAELDTLRAPNGYEIALKKENKR